MGLELKEISKKFSDFNILTNFSAGDGELLTLLGPSGCGKTTTLQIIAGIIGPDKGKILLNGKDITRQAPWERNIGIVFQDYALFPHMNVADNISYGLRIRKLPQSEIRLILKKYLSLVQLTGYENRSIESLSGGEKQRVALARALAPDPGLLLLDEPLSALDTGMRKMLRKEIRRIQQELDITTIYITHDQEEALSISDKIVIMHDGRVEQTGTPWEIYNHPKSIFTANFMGETNKIPCRIRSVSESEGILLVSDQINTSFHLPYLDQTENDKEYYLVFKPQGTKISDNKRDKAGLNEIKGNVLSTEFTGRCLTVEFKCNGLILKTEKRELKEENAIKMEKDTPITVWIDPDKCWIVPR